MPVKAESAIRTNIANHINRSGWALVVAGSIKTAQGTPDIVGTIWNSDLKRFIPIAVEVKTDEGTPSAIQIEVLKHMRNKGYLPMVVSSVRQFDEIVKDYGRFLKYFLLREYPTYTKLKDAHGTMYGIWDIA